MQIDSVADWYKSLTILLLITGLALAACVAVFSLSAGAIVFAAVACIILYSTDLALAVPFMLFLLPFDIHRQIDGRWMYLDFVFLALALPLARLPLRIPKTVWMFVPYFLFLTIAGASRAVYPTRFWGHILRWAIGLLLAYAIYSLKNRESVILALGATLIPLCLYAVYQLAIDDFGSLWEWMFPHWVGELGWVSRARSLLSRPNEYGYFCSIVTVMLLALACRRYRRRLCLFLAAFGAIGLILSGSRGAMGGFALCLLILVVESKVFLRTLAMTLPIAAFAWMFSLFPVRFMDRSAEPMTATEGRLMVWSGAVIAFSQHPFIGIGGSNLAPMMNEFADSPSLPAHNAYLQILAETGTIGFILFFVPFVCLLRSAWKRRTDRLTWAGLLSLVVFCVHGLVDALMVNGEASCMLLFFCVLGITADSSSKATH